MEEPDHGVLPTSISTAHEERSDDNNDLTISETFQVHNETVQDADETAKEDAPQDDHAESSSAVQETIAGLPSPDIAQDRSQREEGSWNAKEEAIHHEVWKQFDVRMKMLRSEREDLGARFATRLEERQREVQQNDTQENEDEDGIITEIEEEFRQERNGLQNDIDDFNEAFTLEFSEREFHELRYQAKEPDEEDPQEASTGACTLKTSDASITNNDVEDGTGDAGKGLEEVELGPEDDVNVMYPNREDDVEANNEEGIITEEDENEDEEVEMKFTEEPPIQPLDEQRTGDTAPASSYDVSSEADPPDYVGPRSTTMEQEDPVDQTIPWQASADAPNPVILPDDNMDINKKSNDPGEDADSNSSRLNNKIDRADDADSNHNAPSACASIGPYGQQEVTLESKEAESQEGAADGFNATEEPGGSKITRPSGATVTTAETTGSESPEVSGEAEVTGNTASNDSGLSSNSPASTVPSNNDPTSTAPTTTVPTNTNTIPTHNVPADHASQRRVRHHARKAKSKKYGVNTDNSKKGGF